MNKEKKNLLITGVVCLVVGVGLGYFGAHAMAPSRGGAAGMYGTRAGMGGAGGFAGRAGGMNGGLVAGTVASKDATSITVDTRDGSSKVVLLGSGTTVSKSVSGALTDVAVGSTVIVTGTANSDGSVSATNVQLRPAGSVPIPSGTTPAAGAGAPAAETGGY